MPIERSEREVTWLDGRVFRVQGWRCLACMARTVVNRDADEAVKEQRPVRGTYFHTDGRGFSARLLTPAEQHPAPPAPPST